jgi:ribosomal protein S18 acetylase RimI-like enzyme
VLHLRRYEDADEPIVRRLHVDGMRRAGAHAGDGPWDDDLRAIRSTYLDDAGEFLLGELDGEVVAIGALRRVSQTTAEIKRMRVDARHQRRGFARAMLSALESRARELGYTTLRLDTTVGQRPARDLYRSSGYREVGRTTDPAGFDLLLYEKPLTPRSARAEPPAQRR